MLASLHGYNAVVRVLLAHCPVDIDQTELKGRVYSNNGDLVHGATALWCALDRAHYVVAQSLIDLGKASVNNGPFHPLLIDAIIRERFDIVCFLVENDYADVNETVTNDQNKCSSLIVAAAKGNIQIMTYLIERGAKLDCRTCIHENTPLTVAATEGHVASVRLLCLAGASSSMRNRYGKTPLILAAENSRLDVVDFLLDYNQDETAFNDLELLASSYMVSNNDDERHEPERMIRFLRQSIERRVLLNMPKSVAQPIAAYDFHKECQFINDLDQIQHDTNRLYTEALLIRERILIPQKNESLFDPLLKRVTVLVERNEFDRALHLAFPNFPATRLLLAYGKQWIDLNAINTIRGDTALHIISRSSKRVTNTNPIAVVELLINAGAHIDCVNEYGETPLAVAIHNEIQDLLRLKQNPPSLKCICARFIADQQLAYECLWPTQTPLNTFVLLHGGLRREHSFSESDSISFVD
ncbi:unnamed protein product [Rotaria sp. Silwood2]|nr:unnamed protein product [Rotaria sp. Silwood2]